MVKVVLSAYSTDTTLLAMENLFILSFIVVERTNRAKVDSEIFVAACTSLLLWLFGLAPKALNARHLVAIKLMIFFGVELVF